MELRSLYIEFHLCLNSRGILNFFFQSTLFNLITISMNLFNQLVIVIRDPIMEG